ncbi:Uncharacterised protein [Mycobacteroides abscessus subsp. abscessus]|nr:Uncharacterised protein [Mycobacteroides abscessus subsp. abscessus]
MIFETKSMHTDAGKHLKGADPLNGPLDQDCGKMACSKGK